MLSKKKLKNRIKEINLEMAFEKGRLNCIDEKQDVQASRGARLNIQRMQTVIETLKWAMNKQPNP